MEFQGLYRPRKPVLTDCSGEPITKQAFRDECDINQILRRYIKTNQLPPPVRVGTYGDFTGPTELLEARLIIIQAEAQFAALPSPVRERFKNDPARFLAFVQDKKNHKEARELGLLQQEPEPDAQLAELKRIADAVTAPPVAK